MTAPGAPPLTALAALVGRIADLMRAGDDPAARAAAATSVEELRVIVGDTAPAGAASFDLAQISDALSAFAEWLRTPTRDSEVRAERAMAELQAALGPLVGWNPAREDAERRAQYRREARASLDNLFPDGIPGVSGKLDTGKKS